MATPQSKSTPPSAGRYKFIVSACLAGINCTYNGKNNLTNSVKKLVEKGKAIPLCPEVSGGLPIPREKIEIYGGTGKDVLDKTAPVITTSGKDVSKNVIRGAFKALRTAKKYNIKRAILKSLSPSCGSNKIYNGTFKKITRQGSGVLAALLFRNKIKIYTEKDNLHAK